ncbi:MAG: hypothetical protein K2O00_01860 [Muribaculaceae bacterium]|nr:hypothetical protein [Muribaculaceae bacterium]
MLINFLTFIAPHAHRAASHANNALEAKVAIPGITFPIMWAAIVLVVLLLITIFSSMSVPFRPSGTDNTTRKILFWIFAVATPICAFVTNIFTCHVYSEEIFGETYIVPKGQSIAEKFTELLTNISIIAIVSFFVFVIIGFILSKAFKSSKLGSWF